jgi:hypothetical protein
VALVTLQGMDGMGFLGIHIANPFKDPLKFVGQALAAPFVASTQVAASVLETGAGAAGSALKGVVGDVKGALANLAPPPPPPPSGSPSATTMVADLLGLGGGTPGTSLATTSSASRLPLILGGVVAAGLVVFAVARRGWRRRR